MNTFKQTVNINICDINPSVLHCSFFPSASFRKDTRLGQRFVYDYEIEYISEGKGDGYIIIDYKEYPVREGDIVFRRPGATAEGVMPYSGYTLCFDPSGKTHVSPEEYWNIRYREFLHNYSNEILDGIPTIFHSSSEKLLSLFQSSYHEFINPGITSPLIQKSNMLRILNQLYIDINTEFSSPFLRSSAYYSRLKTVIEYISINYDKPLALNDLAKLAELSPNYFHTVFTQTVGKTLNEFITEIRINKAKELLLNTNLKISVIAEKCGFDNTSYFSSVFRKKSKKSPSNFKNIMKLT
jgi:AraC family transcriptional regulator